MSDSIYESRNYAKQVKKLLSNCDSFELRIGQHVRQERMVQRQIKIEAIWHNLNNPSKLYYAKKRKKNRKYEESYKCYFKMSGQQHHIYGIVFNFRYNFIKLVTVIKDRPQLQRKFKYAKN